MKTLIKHQSLIFIIGIPATAFLLLLIWHFPKALAELFQFHWIFLVILVFIAISRFGKIRLTSNQITRKISMLQAFGILLLLQISFQILSFEMLRFVTYALPILTTAPQAPNFIDVLKFLNFQEGFFPWSLAILITINYAYQAYIKQENAFFHHTTNRLFLSSANQKFGVTCNYIARGGTMLGLSGTLLLLSVWLVNLLIPSYLSRTIGFNLATFAVIFSMILISIIKPIKKLIKKGLKYHLSFPARLLGIVVVFSGLMMALIVLFHAWGSILIDAPSIIQSLQAKDTLYFWLLFLNCWWLQWIPVLSVTLAFYANHFRIRDLILALLCWPLLSSLFIFAFHSHLKHALHFPEFIHFGLAVFAFINILILIVGKNRFPMLSLCYLSANDHYKPRSQPRYLYPMIGFMIFILYLYLPAGLWTLAPLFIVFGLTILVILWMSVVSLCVEVFKTKFGS